MSSPGFREEEDHGRYAYRMQVTATPDGSIVDTLAVPDCADEASECAFIDRETAFESAAAAGRDLGLVPLRWSFRWGTTGILLRDSDDSRKGGALGCE